jgi:amino acid transporter
MPPRALKFRDVVLYTLAMMLSVRWPAATAAVGPVAPLMWLAAMLVFLVPVVLVTAELVSRFPGSGGIYDWTREAFGPFWGFQCGWLYWAGALPYFSGVLVYAIATAGSAVGGPAQAFLATTSGYLVASLLIAVAVAALHMRGFGVGKWVSNLGAIGACGLVLFMIMGGLAVVLTHGSATDFAHADYHPPLNAQGAVLWSVMTLAFVGPEAAAFLKDDVEGGVKTILKALAVVGVLAMLAYGLATMGILAMLPAAKLSQLGGLPDALRACLQTLGAPGLAPLLIAIVPLTMLGGYAAWFGVLARLPVTAGVDNAMPKALAKLDPRTGAPVNALLAQTVVVLALIVFSAFGASVKAAYDFLIAMTVISSVLPFLFMFAAQLALGDPPAGIAWRIPGGPWARRGLAAVGLVATLSAIVCSAAPGPDVADKFGAVMKIVAATAVLVLGGAAAYFAGHRAAGAVAAPAE